MELGSIHALKVVEIHRAQVRDRLLDEGRTQATLIHPNVLRVSDVLLHGGVPMLVMEYIDGPSLDLYVFENGRPDLGTALSLGVGITRGLRAAHARSLVHRDLKPANVLLLPTPDGFRPLLADFGLVKILDDERRTRRAPTRTGVAMGTAEFMAPEQIRNAAGVDHRADLYSLGCVLYVLLTGQLPFPYTDLVQLHECIVSGRYVRVSDRVPGVPREVDVLVAALLRPSPEDRPSSCDEVLAVLESAEARVPSGPSTFRPADLLAAAATTGPAWTAIHGETADRRLPRLPPARPTSMLAAPLLLPILVATIGIGLRNTPVAAPPPPVPMTAIRPEPVPSPVEAVPEPPPSPAPPAPPAPPPEPESVVPRSSHPRPAPAPAPVEEPKTVPSLTSVAFTGDASRVWLVGKGRRHTLPSRLPSGDYQVIALFPGTEPIDAGRLTIAPFEPPGGPSILLRCSSFALRCRP